MRDHDRFLLDSDAVVEEFAPYIILSVRKVNVPDQTIDVYSDAIYISRGAFIEYSRIIHGWNALLLKHRRSIR